jgi:hypothetical protein
MRLSFFSIREAQEAHVIPPIDNSIDFGALGRGSVRDAMTAPLSVGTDDYRASS